MNKEDKLTETRALDHQTPSTPTSTQSSWKELARQWNPKAIASLLNHSLQPKGITVKVALDQRCLQVMLISAQVPGIELVKVIRDRLNRLRVESIEQVKIYGKQVDEDIPDWHQEFEFVLPSLAQETFAEPVNLPTRTPPLKLTAVKLSTVVVLVAITLVGISYFAPQITEVFEANIFPKSSSYQSSPNLEPSTQYQAALSAAEQAMHKNANMFGVCEHLDDKEVC